MLIFEGYLDKQNAYQSYLTINTKANGKILFDFCGGNQGDADFQVRLAHKVILAALYGAALVRGIKDLYSVKILF